MNKNNLINVGVITIVIAVGLATIWHVNQRTSELKATVDRLNGLSVALPPEFKSKLEDDFSDIAKSTKGSADKAVVAMTNNMLKAVGTANSKMDAICTANDKAVDEIKSKMATTVESANSKMDAICAANDKAVDEIKSKMVAAVESANSKIDSVFEANDKAVDEMKSKMVTAVESANSKMDAICAANDKAVDEIKSKMATAVESANSNMVAVCREKILKAEEKANDAYLKAVELANAARSSGDSDLARIYAVNAISHGNDNVGVDCYKLYYDIIAEAAGKDDDWRIENYDRLEKFIASAIALKSAEDVTALLDLAGKVRGSREELVNKNLDEPEEEEPVAKKEEIARDNLDRLAKRIDFLSRKVSGLSSERQDDRELLAAMVRETFQNVETLYSALIGEDDPTMEAATLTQCYEKYKAAKMSLSEFEKSWSFNAYKSIEEDVDVIKRESSSQEVTGVDDGHFTQSIVNIRMRVAKLREKALGITAEEYARNVAKWLGEDIAKVIDELSKKRMESYQQFAIANIKTAAECVDKYGSKFDDDKKDWCMRKAWGTMQYVSPGLLVPEVSEFYTKVWTTMFDKWADGQHGPEDGLDGDKNLSKPTRWKLMRAKARGKQLEDF